ncbi:NUDIX hydrolase [Paenibacillus harenae]|uniref:8-oxo-dGTP diphosphatase n=1 Tax=Paenibacillus harenae TaxID=306543 RepID=A0ABT9UB90_PAEHA|nr:8-oxo-dGTP diphosphatase [Paenibacillus harenae]MDQ0116276.1 8-oxo-dGTP diphosphatase [Paenibacillus harenae]
MLAYTICFIKRGNEILLLNREKSAWMGCWNGIGGKIEQGESPRESMLRELEEETGIAPLSLHFKGIISWKSEMTGEYGGMYTYVAELHEGYAYETPFKTDEGILDWKTIDWIMHPSNEGVAANIPLFLPSILEDPDCYEHCTIYKDDELIAHYSHPIETTVEE